MITFRVFWSRSPCQAPQNPAILPPSSGQTHSAIGLNSSHTDERRLFRMKRLAARIFTAALRMNDVMDCLADTNVLVRSIDRLHPHHPIALNAAVAATSTSPRRI